MGKYLCFVRQDWPAGLAHLAAGDPGALQEAARDELAGSDAAGDTVKLADGWWRLGQAAKGKERSGMIARSRHWYETALPHLAGLTEARVAQRLQEIADQDALHGRSR